jgi:hypothetical protein
MDNDYFDINDYRYSIFNGELPAKLVTPFSRWGSSPVRDLGIIMQIVSDDVALFNDTLHSKLKVIGESTKIDLSNVSEFILLCLQNTYVDLKVNWIIGANCVFEIAQESTSRVVWSAFKHVGLPILKSTKLHDVQVLWVHANVLLDRKEQAEESFQMFDYLSAFVNPQQYKNLKDRESARVNVAYDAMHNALASGDMDKFDTIKKV